VIGAGRRKGGAGDMQRRGPAGIAQHRAVGEGEGVEIGNQRGVVRREVGGERGGTGSHVNTSSKRKRFTTKGAKACAKGTKGPPCHCEERSDEAISIDRCGTRLLRFARNDELVSCPSPGLRVLRGEALDFTAGRIASGSVSTARADT